MRVALVVIATIAALWIGAGVVVFGLSIDVLIVAFWPSVFLALMARSVLRMMKANEAHANRNSPPKGV